LSPPQILKPHDVLLAGTWLPQYVVPPEQEQPPPVTVIGKL
jgi:hypothetical protein